VQEPPGLELTGSISPYSANPSSCADETGLKVLPGTIEFGRLMDRRPHSVKPLKHPICVLCIMVSRGVNATAKKINEGMIGSYTVAMPS
jgi:hypothetical protein